MRSLGPLAAVLADTGDPAKGTPLEDLVPASVAGAIAAGALLAAGLAYRRGRFPMLERAAALPAALPQLRGLPPWAAGPLALTSVSLLTAVFGFYWDVSTHIDNGRDAGPFANPSHVFILVGLAGLAVAGFLAVVLGAGVGGRSSPPVGGVLLLACGLLALAGFPLDDVWHRLFGQDVTLWGPTHVQMVAGASLATLAVWSLYVEATRQQPRVHRRGVELRLAAAFLVGLSTLQAEFDFGVPQFRLLYQPVLISLAAGIGLVTARLRAGPGAALVAAAGFLLVRGALALLVGGLLGRSVPHFPLFAVEALVVEAAALAVPRRRPVLLGVVAGAGIGTAGLAAEWAWSHAWLPLPWRSGMLTEAVLWSAVAGVAGGVLGALAGRAMAGGEPAARPVSRWSGALAGAAAIAALAWPMPTHAGDGLSATVALTDVAPEPAREVAAIVALQPRRAGDGADFLTMLAWQGAEWQRRRVVIDHLERAGPGRWRTSEPIPVHGEWKAILRLHDGRTLAALPVFLPGDPGIPAPEVPAPASFTRPFVRDKVLLQREFTGGPTWLEAGAYTVLGAIAAGWLAIVVWGLARLLDDRPGASVAGGRVALDRRRPQPARSGS